MEVVFLNMGIISSHLIKYFNNFLMLGFILKNMKENQI